MNIDASEIKDGMTVKLPGGKVLGQVGTVQGDYLEIKLSEGEPRWISLVMVESVADEVQLNASEEELKDVWVTEDPTRPEKMTDG